MSRLPLAAVVLLFACGPEPEVRPPGTGDPTTTGLPGGTPTYTTHTGDSDSTPTTTVTTTYDCTTPWPATLGVRSVGDITSSEDFDITADGMLIHIESGNLVERDITGATANLISPNVTTNAAGTRVLKNGDIAVADVQTGTLILVDRITGQKTPLHSFNWPNGIDVDTDDNIYISDFADAGLVARINAYNPADYEVLGQNMNRPNGLVLSPDGQTLYIAANWSNQLWAIDRNLDGTWGQPRIFQDNPGSAQSVTTDVCGAVYWEAGSEVWRKRADGTDGGPVANAQGGYFPNLRYGNDMGGFQRDHLYGLSNGHLYEMHVGVPGKKHIAFQ